METGSGIFITIVITVICAVIISGIVAIFNNFIRLKNEIERALANIDVLLKQRSDEIPNLIETVKGYMKHEKTLFEDITKARTSIMTAKTLSSKASASNVITDAIKSIFAVAENYPKLQANENFLKLQNRITSLENEIADRREFYNESVTIYNIKRESVPDVLLAKMMSLPAKELFKATDEEKKVVNVKLN
jgi:LemA protein